MIIINYIVEAFQSTDIDEAMCLLETYYRYENEQIELLPDFADYQKNLKRLLQVLIDKEQGIVIRENNVMLGYIAGFPIPELFGKEEGIFVPVFGHATIFSKRDEIEQLLYTHAAQQWVNSGILTHVIAVFAHDITVRELYFQNGFGNRCVDAIRKLYANEELLDDKDIEEVTQNNVSVVEAIHKEHTLYYRSSPIFMPTLDEDALTDLKSWFDQETKKMYCIKKDGKAIGYIRYQISGESIFSTHSSIRNITGLYVLPEYRNHGIAKKLLEYIENIMANQGVKLVGVDYESINPKANRFWSTYFIPYTFSLVRRIDERITNI